MPTVVERIQAAIGRHLGQGMARRQVALDVLEAMREADESVLAAMEDLIGDDCEDDGQAWSAIIGRLIAEPPWGRN